MDKSSLGETAVHDVDIVCDHERGNLNELEPHTLSGQERQHVVEPEPETTATSSQPPAHSVCGSVALFWKLQFNCDPLFPPSWDADDSRLSLWSPYGMSSFTYATFGILSLTVFSGNFVNIEPSIPIPQALEAWCMVLQSVATVLADVFYLHKISPWHLADRWLALCNTVLVLVNLIWLPIEEQLVYVCTVAAGLAMLANAREARVNADMGRFTRWHAIWHCMFPVSQILWIWSRECSKSDPMLRIVILASMMGVYSLIVLDFVFCGCCTRDST